MALTSHDAPLTDHRKELGPRMVTSVVQGHKRLCRRARKKTGHQPGKLSPRHLLVPFNQPWLTVSPQRAGDCPQDSRSLARGMIMTKSTLLQKRAPNVPSYASPASKLHGWGAKALPAPRKSLAGESAGTQSLTNSISVAAWTPAKTPHSPGLTSCF